MQHAGTQLVLGFIAGFITGLVVCILAGLYFIQFIAEAPDGEN